MEFDEDADVYEAVRMAMPWANWGIESSIRRDRDSRPTSASASLRDDWQAVRWTKAAIDEVVFAKT